MPDIPLPLSSSPGATPLEAQGRLINAYVEPLEGGEGSYVRRRVPGLIEAAPDNEALGPVRGFHFVSNTLLIAQGGKLCKIVADGTRSVLGDLPGTGAVTIASNNKAPIPDILCVTSAGIYALTISGAPVSFTDPDLPQPNSVCFIDGYFIMTLRDGRVFASGLNSTTFSGVDFAKAEAKAGGLYRGVVFGQQLYLMGPNATEVWYNAANPTGFPFTRASVIPVGLVAPTAVAGMEDGFNLALIWVGSDRRVWQLTGGYTPQPIATPDVARALSEIAAADISTLIFTAGEHACCAITGPDFTWVYDLSTNCWHERASYRTPNWRASMSARAFDAWFTGDRKNAQVHKISESAQEESGEPLIFCLRTKPAAAFPNRVRIHRADFGFVMGRGLVDGREPIETDPVVRIRYSDDGGNSFSQPIERSLGRHAKFDTRITVNRLGLTGPFGRVYELEVSDPVYVGLLTASHEAEARMN
ncbi:hypothetical protein IZ6_10940 [Terrihabitans soli]|uniref:Uncharacterized protein n=1 Tax=Terrihabitans soli TaxID=708113 RepID=A0A6S6QN29_9HYPH|nr:hypothetical protein [Terrihabitans soli]BCJ90359.1 hypothetical protein IZ6_10940 [Terrihabitans soli]